MKHNMSAVPLCPFYKDEDRQRIFCEGVAGSAALHVTFSVPNERKEFGLTHCRSWDWEQCPVAVMLWQQYDDPVPGMKKLKRVKPRPGKRFSAYSPDELREISRRGGVASGAARRAKRQAINAERVHNTALAEQRRENIAMLRANAALLLECQQYCQR